MKYRRKSSKIKYQHHMIDGLKKLLEDIEPWEEILSITPARIKRKKASTPVITLETTTTTDSGIKCLAKSSTGVQEVFIVTNNPDGFKERLTKLNLTQKKHK